MASPAQIRANTKYVKNHTKRYTIQCHNEYDKDIIQWLTTKENYAQYIKALIREDIKNNKVLEQQ